MPVEIRELQITAVVQDAATPGQASGTAGNASNASIVAECVEQVLEILKQKNDR